MAEFSPDDDLEATIRADLAFSPRMAATNVDEMPDQGARAMELSRATGVPAPAIYGNILPFESQTKAQMAAALVRNSPELSDYVRNNSMASIVSNDDYGNLSTFSQGAGKLAKLHKFLNAPIAGVVEGFGEGFGSGQLGEATAKTLDLPSEFAGIVAPVELLGRFFGGVIGAARGGATAIGGEQFGRDIGAMIEYGLIKPESKFFIPPGETSIDAFLNRAKQTPAQAPAPATPALDAPTLALPWIREGIEPPRGLHPEIDKAKADVNDAGLQQLQEDVTNAQGSATHERSPELFRQFAVQHYGDSTIGISGDTVAALYGDKVPAADDGILGWVPGLAEQLAAARETGADIHVPIADWVTYVDPALSKQLQDDIRIWPGGVTARETTEAKAAEPLEVTPPIDAPLAQVRNAAASEPAFSNGDRKLTLERTETAATMSPEEAAGFHDYKIKNSFGNEVGDLIIRPDAATKTLNVSWVADNASGDVSGFGASAVRDLKHQLAEIYPEYEWITGNRVTGARGQADLDMNTPQANPRVALHEPIRDLKQTKQVLANESTDSALKDQFDAIRADAAGLDKPSYKRLQKLIDMRFDADVAAALKHSEREQAKRQTKEWKANEKEVRTEVEANVRARPDVKADLLIGSGEVNGLKVRQRIPLRAEDLTPEQKAALPEHYYSANGLALDEAAEHLGFQSGDAMVEVLAKYTAAKGEMTPQEMVKHLTDMETEAQMETRFGDLNQNIMSEAVDQALSETNLNLLAEELYQVGLKAGQTIDKARVKERAMELLNAMPVSAVDTVKHMQFAGRDGRIAQREMIAGNWADAFVAMQRQTTNMMIAAEMRKVEKAIAAFNKTAGQFRRREGLKSVEPDYTPFIQQILQKVGKKVSATPQDMLDRISSNKEGAANLEEFVETKKSQLREMPVWEQLYDPNWAKKFDDLTVEEFQAVHDSVKAMVANGRNELKIVKAGEEADFNEIKGQLIAAVERFKTIEYDADGGRVKGVLPSRISEGIRGYLFSGLQIENILNRWDAFDSKGVWNQYVTRDLIDGANQEDAWRRDYAKKIRSIRGSQKTMKKLVDNPLFRDPASGQLMKFNRERLLAVMANMGTKSNLEKMSGGYGLKPEEVAQWVHAHATKEDWDFVQKIWDDLFKDIKAKSDLMYGNLTGGVQAKNIPATPIETPFGTYAGGYYPVIFHPTFEGKSRKLMGKSPLEQENYVRATPSAGYTKDRTGYVAPLALSFQGMPNQIAAMLHDIALRPAAINAYKVFSNQEIRSAIAKHYGSEYRDGLMDYLQSVVNSQNRLSRAQQQMQGASEFLRQNLISTLVGPGTFLKHTPTAFVTSMREVGPINFLKSLQSLFSINEETGERNFRFANEHSLELQRRHRNALETLHGATNELQYGSNKTRLRQMVMEFGATPVALGDMLSAYPTWLAKYKMEMESHGVKGDAIYEADRAVRRAHGSSAVTNRPAIMRDSNPWFTSLYTFFSDMLNRQMETLWKAGDTLGLIKDGKWSTAAKAVPGLAASLFAYALWPAIVEHLVSPTPESHDDSWGWKASKALGFTLASSWIGVRDVASAVAFNRDPQFGLIGTFLGQITNEFRDLAKEVEHMRRNTRMTPQEAGKFVQHGISFLGAMTGFPAAWVGPEVRFGMGVNNRIEHPKDGWGWATGLRYGTLDKHPQSFQEYMRGRR